MFGLERILDGREEKTKRIKYKKDLGFNEFNEETGNKIEVSVFVFDVEYGYNIYRVGATFQMIRWEKEIDIATEWAVDYCRNEISTHELHQTKREPVASTE